MARVMRAKERKRLSNLVSENLMDAAHLYKNIRVILTDGKVYSGWLKCIDPTTGTLILVTLKSMNDTFEVTEVIFIRSKYITAIEVLMEVDPAVKPFLLKLYAYEEAAVDEDRRDRLVAFIKASRMAAEVTEDGRSISILGCKINPPYTPDSIMASNPSIARGIGRAIKRFDERSKPVEAEEAKTNKESDAAGDDVNLELGIQKLKLVPDQAYSSSEATGPEKDQLTEFELSSDEFSNNEGGSISSFNGESSATEESYEFVS